MSWLTSFYLALDWLQLTLWGWGNADTSALKCWSIPLIDTLNHYSVNTPATPRLTLEWHSIDTLFDSQLSFIDAHESVVTRLTIDWLLTDSWSSADWLLTEYLSQWDPYQDVDVRGISIKSIDWHPLYISLDSTHDPNNVVKWMVMMMMITLNWVLF